MDNNIIYVYPKNIKSNNMLILKLGVVALGYNLSILIALGYKRLLEFQFTTN